VRILSVVARVEEITARVDDLEMERSLVEVGDVALDGVGGV